MIVRYIPFWFGLGVNIHGLFIEGCGWSIAKTQLQESLAKQLFVEMPVLW